MNRKYENIYDMLAGIILFIFSLFLIYFCLNGYLVSCQEQLVEVIIFYSLLLLLITEKIMGLLGHSIGLVFLKESLFKWKLKHY